MLSFVHDETVEADNDLKKDPMEDVVPADKIAETVNDFKKEDVVDMPGEEQVQAEEAIELLQYGDEEKKDEEKEVASESTPLTQDQQENK